jgi:D-3-phosphoglycerate dehydrogenase
MSRPKVLHIDKNHHLLLEGLESLGYKNVLAYDTPLSILLPKLKEYFGGVIRSRFPINKKFIDKASNLKFIARVGSGLENIDVRYATKKNINLLSAPEGNRNAVGEHALGMLLCLMNKIRLGHESIREGVWNREEHRGWELEGRTVGIIGYGNTGQSFAKKLRGFNNLKVIFYDIKHNLGDDFAQQVPLEVLQENAEILSLHIPESKETSGMINEKFINQMQNPFWLINTSRGKAVNTEDLVIAIKSGKILGAGLDVLEYESSSFYSIFNDNKKNSSLNFLKNSKQVILTPHVGGWTLESHKKLSETILDKIRALG